MKKKVSLLGNRMALSVLLITGLAVAPAIAGSRVTADVTATPAWQLTDDESRAVSIAAGRLLVHVGRARQAIAKSDKAEALKDVEKGLTLIQIIKKAQPAYTVKSSVKAGDLSYEDEQTVKPATVSIFDELDFISLEEPIRISKNRVRKRARNNEPTLNAPVVKDVESMHSQMWLDINMAQGHLEVAKTALSKKGDLKLAQAALTGIEDDALTFEFDTTKLPLVRARENLMLAKTLVQEGNAKAARLELQAASGALREYQNIAGEHHAREVKELRNEIDKLTENVEKDKNKAVSEIKGMWDKLIKWF